MRTELLRDGHEWLRIAGADWQDPLDPLFAAQRGGRWNPPGSFPTLYFNEDVVTARFNLDRFIAGWPYEPEDLRDDTGPILVRAALPRTQRVADCHSPAGVAALGLPPTFPLDGDGRIVGHETCQPIGETVHRRKLRGVRSRSARVPDRAGRELAWFPASAASRARPVGREAFSDWYWG
jgi:hypothetical protein